MASVTPRKNRDGTVSWRVQFRIDGKLRQETFDDQTGALQFGRLVDRVGGDAARKVRLARAAGEENSTPTLRDWTATYLDVAQGYLSGITPGTAESYRQIAERSWLIPLGDMPLDAITEQHVAQWVHWQEQQTTRAGATMAGKTVKNYHALLSQTLAAAVSARHLERNVAKGAKLTRTTREEMVCLSHEQFDAIYDRLPDYARPLALFLVTTGARWGEATALTWADFRLHDPLPTVRIAKAWKRGPGSSPVIGPPKTRKSVRTISLWPELVAALGTPGAPSALAFASPGGAGQRAWTRQFHERAWTPAVQTAAVTDRAPRVHDLRHTHASWLLNGGVPIHEVQARLGHENIATTVDTYSHVMPQAHVRMAEVAAAGMAATLARGPRVALKVLETE